MSELFIVRVKREVKRVYRNGCQYNERLNVETGSDTGGSKTSRIQWVAPRTAEASTISGTFFFGTWEHHDSGIQGRGFTKKKTTVKVQKCILSRYTPFLLRFHGERAVQLVRKKYAGLPDIHLCMLFDSPVLPSTTSRINA